MTNATEPEVDVQEKIKLNKTEVMDDTSIPEDAKLLLMQNLTRQLIEKLQEERQKPLLVKNAEQEPAQPQEPGIDASLIKELLQGTSSRGPKILKFFRDEGMQINDNSVYFGGIKYSILQMNTIINKLCKGSIKSTDTNVKQVLSFIKTKSHPANLFPASVEKLLKPQSGGRICKRRQNMSKIWIKF